MVSSMDVKKLLSTVIPLPVFDVEAPPFDALGFRLLLMGVTQVIKNCGFPRSVIRLPIWEPGILLGHYLSPLFGPEVAYEGRK